MCGAFGGMGVFEDWAVGEAEEGRKCAVRDWRRDLGVDMALPFCEIQRVKCNDEAGERKYII